VREVNRKVLVIAVVLMAVAMLLLPLSVVSATTPTQITGKWGFTGYIQPAFTNVKKAGANAFITQHNTGEYFEGPILGTFEQYVEKSFHYGDPEIVETLPESPPFTLWFSTPSNVKNKIYRTFEGTVDGNEGTLTMSLESKGTSPPTPLSTKGTWVIISGTGELSNLYGQGTWWNLGAGVLEYEGQIHFDP
jgi:hypothetical protein